MILASHYVVEGLLYVLEGGNPEDIKKMCEKYSQRYNHDSKLVNLCNMLIGPKEIDDKTLEDMKSKFRELSNARKLETSGGTRLWFEDRRR